MPETSTLLVFSLAAVALIAVPGPNLIYITTRSIGEGRRAGLASALGVETGTLVYVAVTAAGLSALLASSQVAFSIVRYAGAAYLIYLGIRALLDTRHPPASHAGVGETSLITAYRQGLLVQLLNPKVALFFLALFPQFLDAAAGPLAPQIVVLGVLLALLGLLIDAIYAVTAGALGSWLRAHPTAARRQGYFAGTVYLALGAAAALSGGGRAGAHAR